MNKTHVSNQRINIKKIKSHYLVSIWQNVAYSSFANWNVHMLLIEYDITDFMFLKPYLFVETGRMHYNKNTIYMGSELTFYPESIIVE